jgi:hypothetical protein
LPAELNKRILASRPSIYFAELRAENTRFEEATKTHLIPVGKGAGISNDDYLEFLKARSQLIIQEVERLTGVSTAPSEDQRFQSIKRLELRLRALIHNALNEGHEQGYWIKAVPEDVRVEVEKRIEKALRKQPDSRKADFEGGREKLDFCTLADYAKIVRIRSNWPLFEPVFRRASDFERHVEALSEFRNALMHNRPLTEISRRGVNWPLFGSKL